MFSFFSPLLIKCHHVHFGTLISAHNWKKYLLISSLFFFKSWLSLLSHSDFPQISKLPYIIHSSSSNKNNRKNDLLINHKGSCGHGHKEFGCWSNFIIRAKKRYEMKIKGFFSSQRPTFVPLGRTFCCWILSESGFSDSLNT